MPEIEIVVASDDAPAAAKSWIRDDALTITDGTVLATALTTLSGLLADIPAPSDSAWEISEVELKAEVTLEGGLRIFGSGATASGTGGITVRLRRR
jgi:hypothetical protein